MSLRDTLLSNEKNGSMALAVTFNCHYGFSQAWAKYAF